MGKFSNVSLGRNLKRYSHPFIKDVNTTCDFGTCQPVLCVSLEQNDSISGNFKELLRLAPMPVPTFSRVYKETHMRFVPYSEVCPFYDCVRSQKSFSVGTHSYYPDHLPTITNRYIVLMLLYWYSEFRLFNRDGSTSNYRPSSDSEQILSFLNAFYSPDSDFTYEGEFLTSTDITADSADFILESEDKSKILMARLSPEGVRLRKQFIGLGYSLNIMDDEPKSFLPILAYYKAYFDTYSPQRVTNWLDTVCYSLIQYQMNNYLDSSWTNLDINSGFSNGSYVAEGVLHKFFNDLSDVFYTISDDFVSAHTATPSSYEAQDKINDGVISSNAIVESSDGDVPVLSSNTTISNSFLKFLSRVASFANKDTVIGQKLSNWLKVHFGSDVANSVFEDSYRIGYYRLDASINDIFSTSDTSSQGGEQLGVYAGKGLGYKDNNSFKFTAPTPGIVIAFTCVVPQSGYFQGTETYLRAIDRDTMFLSEFDGIGYEITSYNELFSDNGIASRFVGFNNMKNKGFGYIPRYTGLKHQKNIVNGDMSRRSTLSNMSPYYLDRLIVVNTCDFKKNDDGTYQIGIGNNLPPQASEAWRFSTRYPYLGNFNRIFYNSGTATTDVDFQYGLDDNFISQSVFEFVVKSMMLPVSMSYDTYSDVDNSSIDVNKQ